MVIVGMYRQVIADDDGRDHLDDNDSRSKFLCTVLFDLLSQRSPGTTFCESDALDFMFAQCSLLIEPAVQVAASGGSVVGDVSNRW